MRLAMRHLVPSLAWGGMLTTSIVSAQETDLIGPRALGMAGSNVATVSDTPAQYHNPAAFGFMAPFIGDDGRDDKRDDKEKNPYDNTDLGRRTFGWDIADAQAGVAMHGQLGDYLELLGEIDYDELRGIADSRDLDTTQVQQVVEIVMGLAGVDDPKNAVIADANAGAAIRLGRFGLGVRVSGQALARVEDIDTRNLGLNQFNPDSLINDLAETARGDASFPRTWAPHTLTTANIEMLREQANNNTSANFTTAMNYIDWQVTRLIDDGTIQRGDVEGGLEVLADLIAATGGTQGGSLKDNITAVLVRGFALAEVPVSYGYAPTDWISFGATVKLMYGRQYGTSIFVFNEDNEQIFKNIDEVYEDTTTFGVDLGVMLRIPYFQFGLLGRNLNRPTFDGFTQPVTVNIGGATRTHTVSIDKVSLDPQVSLGAAFIPLSWVMVEGRVDLLKTDTLSSQYDTQRASLGAEVELFRFLELRAGVYKNLAEDDIAMVLTGGVGLDLYLLRLDLAGAVSPKNTVEFDGHKYPEEARVSLGLAMDF